MFNSLSRFLLFFLIVSNSNFLFAQDWGRIWCFGDSAGIDFSDLSMPVPVSSFMDCSESCASVGDSVHGLLMYAHTDYWPIWIQGYERTTVIHNSNHQIMINGDSLIGNAGHTGLTFIPKPGCDSIFYLFQWGFSQDSGLYYSLINPYYNNTGMVLQRNISLPLTDRSLQFGVYGIRHGNGRDWWIVSRNWFQSNRFNLFLVTPDSIFGPFEQNVGSITMHNIATIAISKKGDKLALVNFSGLIETYSFDRCSGQISNPLQIISNPIGLFLGCEFSPDGNLLYVSNSNNIFGGDSLRLFQFDLTNSNPSATRQTIYIQPDPASGGLLKRGPDDKIYFTCLYQIGWPYPDSCRNQYNENLGVINEPNNPGLSCNFSPYSFYLGGKRTYWDLPNNPNYTLGPLTGSVCDSLFATVPVKERENVISIFPNPCSDKLNIVSNLKNTKSIKLFSSDFKLIYESNLKNKFSEIDMSGFSNGIYFLKIGEKHCEKIVVLK